MAKSIKLVDAIKGYCSVVSPSAMRKPLDGIAKN